MPGRSSRPWAPTHASTAVSRERMREPIAAPAAACARVITLGSLPPARGYHATRMFQSLSDKLQATLGDLRSRGALTEEDIDRAMREIRLALLEADVNFRVVKTFVAAVRERAVGQEVLSSLTPGPAGREDRRRGADRAARRRGHEADVRRRSRRR